MAHAPFAPSSSDRWLNCPHSTRLHADQGETEYTREGTFAHTIAEAALRLGLPAEAFRGHSDGEFTVDDEMVQALQVYLDFAAETIARDPYAIWSVENRVVIVAGQCYGTADFVAWLPSLSTLVVADLKYGVGKFVDVADNTQAQLYAIGACDAIAERYDVVPERVETYIVQPRYRTSAPVRRADYTPDDLARMTGRVAVAISRADDPAAMRAGPWCTWCSHRGACPTLAASVMATASEAFAPLATPPVAPEAPELLASLLAQADAIEAWLDGVRARALAAARSGVKIPGWKLVESYGHRAWRDATTAADWLRSCGVEPFAPAPLLSPAAAEKKLPKARRKDIVAYVIRPQLPPRLAAEKSSDEPDVSDPGSAFSPLA